MKYETTLRGAELLGTPAGATEHGTSVDAPAASTDDASDLFAAMPPPGVDPGDAPETQVNRLKLLFGDLASVEIRRV